MPMTLPPADATDAAAEVQPRRHWLRVLARARADDLARLARPVLQDHRFEPLRAPEAGLVMVRARIGNTGDRFNLGEATVSRCVLRHQDSSGRATVGVGYVLGRDVERVGWMARLDALLQQPHWRPRLMADVVAPLAAALAYQRADAQRNTDRSRVQFYTLQSEGKGTP